MTELRQIIADWIRDARKAADLSQEALGARLASELEEDRGYTKANISHWEKQKHSPSLRQIAAVARVTGQGIPEPILQALGSSDSSGSANEDGVAVRHDMIPGAMRVRVGDEPDTVPVRFIKLRLRTGITGFASEPEEDSDETHPVPREVLRTLNVDPAFLLIARVRGQSMEPMMFEDDLVAVNLADRKPINKEVYALNFNGEGCIKQLVYRGGQWYLHSLNPDFGPINMRSGDCQIVGRVVYQPGRIVTGRL